MRFTLLFAALAAASAVFASTLADQIGTVPAFLQLQQQHFHGSLDDAQRAEFSQLAKTLNHQNSKTLKQLTGTSNEAEQLIKDLLAGILKPLKSIESQIESKVTARSVNEDELADGEIVPKDADKIGHVPLFILLNQKASKSDASLEDIEALVKHGLLMLSKGYNPGSLKAMLGTDTSGSELLSKIVKAHKSAPKARNVKPAFPQARRAHLAMKRRAL